VFGNRVLRRIFRKKRKKKLEAGEDYITRVSQFVLSIQYN
jgi:hypothetical protein